MSLVRTGVSLYLKSSVYLFRPTPTALPPAPAKRCQLGASLVLHQPVITRINYRYLLGPPLQVPFPQWLRAATGCLGGGALVRRQCSVHWWDTRPEDEDVGAIPARPCQLAAGRSCSETGTAVYGAWRAASILSYDARTCVYTVKYHTGAWCAVRDCAHCIVHRYLGRCSFCRPRNAEG